MRAKLDTSEDFSRCDIFTSTRYPRLFNYTVPTFSGIICNFYNIFFFQIIQQMDKCALARVTASWNKWKQTNWRHRKDSCRVLWLAAEHNREWGIMKISSYSLVSSVFVQSLTRFSVTKPSRQIDNLSSLVQSYAYLFMLRNEFAKAVASRYVHGEHVDGRRKMRNIKPLTDNVQHTKRLVSVNIKYSRSNNALYVLEVAAAIQPISVCQQWKFHFIFTEDSHTTVPVICRTMDISIPWDILFRFLNSCCGKFMCTYIVCNIVCNLLVEHV